MLRSRLVLTTFLLIVCAGCSDDDPAASPASDPQSTPASSSTPISSAPTSSVPPELAGYGEHERAAYVAAIPEYDAFVKRNEKFYAAGRTTVGAKKFYQRYAIDWSTSWGDLAQVANNNATVTGTTKTVWTKPSSIKLGAPTGDVIVLTRCLDESGRIVTQNGRTVEQPQLKVPHVYTVRLEKRPGESWWRSGIAEQGRTC